MVYKLDRNSTLSDHFENNVLILRDIPSRYILSEHVCSYCCCFGSHSERIWKRLKISLSSIAVTFVSTVEMMMDCMCVNGLCVCVCVCVCVC